MSELKAFNASELKAHVGSELKARGSRIRGIYDVLQIEMLELEIR